MHSIFFHRLLGTVAPRELRVLNTTVVSTTTMYFFLNSFRFNQSITDSQEVEKLIEEKITEFLQNTISSHIKQGKVSKSKDIKKIAKLLLARSFVL